MTEENKNLQEGSEGEININTTTEETATTAGTTSTEAAPEEGKTISQLEIDKAQDNKIKNLTAGIILLAGLLVGSLFVDAAQFFSGTGYSEKALKNAEIFEGGGKTWVAYADPIVKAQVLTVSDEELKDCPDCDPTEVVTWMKKFVPTLVSEKIDVSSPEGKQLVEKYKIKTVPAFLFDSQIKDSEFYNGEAKVLFAENNDKFVLNSSQLGLPVGRYLETPEVSADDPVIGNKEAKVKMVVFSDFQCPYCKTLYATITKVARSYGDKVALVYKEFPLEFHQQAKPASMAAMCANEQGKFWPMADILYNSQAEWGKATTKDIYKTYAKRIGLNPSQFDQCLDQDKYSDKIESDMKLGTEYGVTGTPTGFVGTQALSGVVKEDELKKMIDSELAK